MRVLVLLLVSAVIGCAELRPSQVRWTQVKPLIGTRPGVQIRVSQIRGLVEYVKQWVPVSRSDWSANASKCFEFSTALDPSVTSSACGQLKALPFNGQYRTTVTLRLCDIYVGGIANCGPPRASYWFHTDEHGSLAR